MYIRLEFNFAYIAFSHKKQSRIPLLQVIFTSEAKRVLYSKGADITVDGQLNQPTQSMCPH